eukprot:2051884-Heterocapsa_arctica.AAC.1
MTSSRGSECQKRLGADARGRRGVDVHLAPVVDLLGDESAFGAAVGLQHLDPTGPHDGGVRSSHTAGTLAT